MAASASLSRVRWSIGQVLLPEHFRALEGSLGAESALRIEALGLPSYGFSYLDLPKSDLQTGVVLVQAARLVLPSGELVDVPGNAEIVAPFDLRRAPPGDVTLYLHVLDPPPPPEEAIEPANTSHLSRVISQVVLSDRASVPRSRGRLVVGVFSREAGGKFVLSKDHVPPLLLVGSSPYLVPLLEELRADLASFSASLGELVLSSHDEGEPVRAAQRARIEAIRLDALLGDTLQHGIRQHPYSLFAALRTFLLELYLFAGTAPDAPLPHYDHDDLGRTFNEIVREIEQKVATPPLQTPHVPFVVEDKRCIARDLPPAVLSASELYLVIQRRSADQKAPLEGVRFASPSRLSIVHERALRGVRVTPIARAPFRHGLGLAVDVYRLGGEGDAEQKHVVEEAAVCFYAQPQLAGTRAALFWRRP